MSVAKPKRSGGEKEHQEEAPHAQFLVQDGNLLLEADKKLQFFRRICWFFYSAPPTQALYLQLYHELGNAGMHINGRKYLGNTPTLIAGQRTKMRFGVVGMGNMFHTFHIHGHRWVLPGPDGNKHVGGGGIGDPAAIQNSALVKAVSQFEDTKIFGPANSFVFTIHEDAGEGSFMRAEPALGEWHMHCHVLNHMETGMMGSLLVIQGGETVTQLPRGVPCDMPMPAGGGMGNGGGGTQPQTVQVHIKNTAFNPAAVTIKAGDTVQWVWDEDGHSTTSDTNIWNSGIRNTGATFPQPFPTAGSFPYYCLAHGGPGGAGMHGTVIVNP